MPRSRITSGKFAAEVLANGLVASARNLTKSTAGEAFKKVRKSEWQSQGWFWYDTVEVFHYGVQWVGNTLSRAKLLVHENGAPTTNQTALDLLASFFGGAEQHGEFLRQAGIHMTVAGEGYIIGQEVGGTDQWMVAAAVEVKNGPSDTYKIDGEEVDPAQVFMMRFWRPHPRKASQSDCPTRPLLPILSQIDQLTKYVSAQADSRLSGAGLLVLPNEVTFPTPTVAADGKTQQTGLNAFIAELAETMALAKKDPEDSAARVPMIIQVDGEFVDKINHVTFWTELDENAPELRNEAIRRLALGMDMPPEALLGTGDVNHWGAWQIEDSLIKSHSEPLLALITQAITVGYLRFMLVAEGMTQEEADKFEIVADTADMRLRPNRSKEAVELYDRGELSGAALLRENGFVPEDAMDDDGRKAWLLLKLAQGSPSPELVQAAAEALGITIDVPADAPVGNGERPLRRSLEDHPKRDIPEQSDDAAALLAAGEVALFHALTRAGNRIKSTSAKLEGVPREVTASDRYQFVSLSKAQLDFVLEDAWGILDKLTLPDSCSREQFETALDNYARLLISSRAGYERVLLAKYLTLAIKGELA